jgi:hypothetical protein
MDREILLKRLRHYRGLLKEIEREAQGKSSSSDNSQDSKQKYHAALRELLSAARGNYRLPIEESITLSVEMNKSSSTGVLLNLSTNGAAVRLINAVKPPMKNADAKLFFSLPGSVDSFTISVKTAWAGTYESKCGDIVLGVTFKDVNESIQNDIWNYIVKVYKQTSLVRDDKYSLEEGDYSLKI